MTKEEITRQREIVAGRRSAPGHGLDTLRWVTPQQARAAATLRQELLHRLQGRCDLGCRETKIDCTGLSPGCQRCIRGSWSCLFVNNTCNASCCFCPTPQRGIGEPATNSLQFSRAGDYVDYLERFGFDGASISGGEPLLTPGRTLAFLRAIKSRLGDRIHLWMYTNGLLLDTTILSRLREAGLDEIRINIGAVRYDLSGPRLALEHIDRVTVEIPVVPSDHALLRHTLREMARAGIHHLNLHQLRLTPHNLSRLADRGYTFLHGEQITVLESELQALALIGQARDEGLDLPINYCSHIYKERFQQAAARRRAARLVARPHEGTTASGFIRSLWVSGPPGAISELESRLLHQGAPPDTWSRLAPDRLGLVPDLLAHASARRLDLSVCYHQPRIASGVSYHGPFIKVPLNRRRSVVVERHQVCEEIPIPVDAIPAFERLVDNGDADAPIPSDSVLTRALAYERIPSGLQQYF